MSKQELLEKTSFYLEKLADEKLEEVFHFVEFLYFHYQKSGDKNKAIDFFDFYGKGKGLWKKDAQEYVNDLREDRQVV